MSSSGGGGGGHHPSGERLDEQQPDMTVYQQASTVLAATRPLTPAGPERTMTGIPVTMIWMPYVAFSIVLIVLMLLSFYQYHRKHGHKYHQARDEQADAADASKTTTTTVALEGVTTQGARQTSLERTHESSLTQVANKRQQRNQNNSSSQRPSNRSSTHAHADATKAPPNGGVPTAPPGYKHKYRQGSQDISASEQLIQPSQSETVSARAPAGSRSIDGHRRQLPKRPVTVSQCDEPSTSSSTVSSKNSSNASRGSRSRPAVSKHAPPPAAAKVTYEPDHNGSMVDVRVPVDDSETFQPPKRRDRQPPTTRRQGSAAAAPPVYDQVHFRTDLNTTSLERRGQTSAHMPDITDRIYRGNYVQVRSTSPHSLQSSHCRRTTSFNRPMTPAGSGERAPHLSSSERSGSLPLWAPGPPPPPSNHLPLQPQFKMAAVTRAVDPFTPSGHMQMLSDTEDDETHLLSEL